MANDKKANNKKRKKVEKGNYNSPFAVNFRKITGYDEKKGKTKISQSEIAADIGVSRQTVSEYLLGNTQPNAETIIKIAKKFEVSSDYLLGLSDAPTSDKDLQFICDYTGLSADAIDYISNKNTDYNFKVFIEFVIDYAKKHKSFVNSLSFLRKSAVAYHSEIEFQNVLSNYYEQDNLSDENKKALYKLYKGNENIPPTKTQLYILASLKSDYNSTKYELSENIRDIVNEYSTSKIINEKTNAYYSYAVFTDDETKMLNSNYIEYLKSKIKAGEDNEKE